MEELEKEAPKVRRAKTRIVGMFQKYWQAPGDIKGATFAVQFDVLESETTLGRGCLQYRKSVVQLLVGNRMALSAARQVKTKICEEAEKVTSSVAGRWPTELTAHFRLSRQKRPPHSRQDSGTTRQTREHGRY